LVRTVRKTTSQFKDCQPPISKLDVDQVGRTVEALQQRCCSNTFIHERLKVGQLGNTTARDAKKVFVKPRFRSTVKDAKQRRAG
jgi:hypothetical protein